jgi:hypothetical protein
MKPLGTYSSTCLDDFEIDLKEMDSSGLGWGLFPGSCEHINKRSSFIKGGEFIDKLGDY